MLEHGIGCRADVKKALTWYQLAAEQSDYARAQNCLGSVYYRGSSSSSSSSSSVKGRAAGGGGKGDGQQAAVNANATNTPANTSTNEGIPVNHALAIQWFRKAAAQGNAHAQNNLGICFEEGLGVVRDYAAAKEWYRKASDSNHPSATNNLGYLQLLEKNYRHAMKTFHLAAALGRWVVLVVLVVICCHHGVPVST